ncbi:DUF262 domain-containing HNH endonuclease family protein [Erysipelothrix rhusiopathiae]|nr:DUF262 domain-containing HNH endonuclease family protein [Erysipelothrix rhusiopathiae]
MKITPESKPVSEIFSIEGRTQYKIPIYQRSYSWHPSNIEDLFNDIINEATGYYIGNILVTENEDIDSEKSGSKIYYVVDGQQRLTTIGLFFLATYEFISDQYDISTPDYEDCIGIKSDIKRKLLFEDESTKLELLEKDQEVYENFLGIMCNKKTGRYGNRVFAKRYKYILELYEEQFKEPKELIDFYNKLNQLEVLRIVAENISDAFTVFSSINAKGLPLTLIDLMKSSYLGEATKAGVTQNESMQNWDDLVSIFSDETDNPNSFAITQFLLNNYDTFEGKASSSITKNNALKKYQSLFNKEEGYKYIDTLKRNAEIFSHISPLVEPNLGITFEESINKNLVALKKLDSSQSYPLTLYILKNSKKNSVLSTEVINNILEILIKFFIRRNIVLKPKASNIRSKILEIVRILDGENGIDPVEVVREKLKSISVSDKEFKVALMDGVYDVSSQTVRYIFIDFERKYGKNYFNKQNPDSLDEYKVTTGSKKIPVWTLEHILPSTKNLKYGWPEMISPDNIDQAGYLQDLHKHKLGNLTLTGYNSEMSDKSFMDKRDYVIPGSDKNYAGLRTPLFINDSIPNEELNETIETKDSWTVADIERRTKILVNLALENYNI